MGNPAHRRSGARLAKGHARLGQAAPAHRDVAVDPQTVRGPVVGHSAAACEVSPRAIGADDVRVHDSRCPAAGEVHHSDVPGRIEIARRPQQRVADGQRHRTEWRLARRPKRLGYAREHARRQGGVIRGIRACEVERAVLGTQVVMTLELGPVRGNRRQARLLRRQLDLAVDRLQRAAISDVAKEVGQGIRAGDERSDRHPPIPVDAGEGFVEGRIRIEARSRDLETARRTREAIECDRPLHARLACPHRDAEIGVEVGSSAVAERQRGTDYCDPPVEAAAQLAVALESDAERSERRRQCDAAVGDIEHEIGKCERLVRRRRQKLVDLAPTDLAMHQLAAQPDATRDDPVDREIAVPLQAGFDPGIARNEIRVAGITDDQVADLLGSQANTVEVIAGGNPPPFELALQIMGRDGNSADPDRRDSDQEHDEDADSDDGRDARERPPPRDHPVRRLRCIDLVVAPPLVHGIH